MTFELVRRFFSRRDVPSRRDFLRSLAIGAAAHHVILNALAQPSWHVVTRVHEFTGCSLTRVVITPLSPAELDFLAFHEKILADTLRQVTIPPDILHFLGPDL